IFHFIYDIIRAKYSLGLECSELEKYYLQGIDILYEIGLNEIGYVNTLQYLSLGILLEIPKDKLCKLVKKADEEELDDILFDILVKAYGLSRNIISSKFQKENPYRKTKEIIELALKNNKEASLKLVNYITDSWLKGHADYEWTDAHKRYGYVGLWSFESAAIAKIFNLDDSKLKDDNHYPYDLAHYKNDMTFNKEIDLIQEEESADTQADKFIPANPELEQIIPNEFRDEINQLLVDFSSLEDEDFWNKYDLFELWFTVDDYRMDKIDKQIIGSIVIDRLVLCEYVLQLDYKEDIEDFVDNMKNYWKDSEVKLIRFELDNDQNYYAKVPVSCNLKNVYEVKIYE
ncbi:MAG: DUF1911 domain-containing protein, partial [Lachnospiraceae bacterium]|nr:DUF1911 domain-containing protein [Lachnospiraceae bacterium]